MSVIEYKWWARSERRQVRLIKALERELEVDEVRKDPKERMLVQDMLMGLRTQLERRKVRRVPPRATP